MTKGLVSVLIPSRNELFLNQTIQDVLDKSAGDIEVIVNIDEKWNNPVLKNKRVTYIHPPSPRGLRAGINACATVARGEYLMKLDAHCLVGQGFDEILKKDCEPNMVVIPRRFALNPEEWKIEERTDDKYPIDYMYLDFPRKGKAHDSGTHGVPWKDRREQRKDLALDDTPSLQGSCYFMTKNYYENVLHGLDDTNYGHFAQESQEIGLKTWLGGGRMVVNKLTYYAHLHKGNRYGRMYKLDDPDHVRGAEWSAEHWLNDREPNMKYKFEWLINEKFPGMPSWPVDWKEQLALMGWFGKILPDVLPL